MPRYSTRYLLPQCAHCQLELPLRPAWIQEPGRDWFCARCGTLEFGVINHELPIELLRRVRGRAIEIDTQNARQPPTSVGHFLHARGVGGTWGVEKRNSTRHLTLSHSPVVATDDQFRPEGDPFIAVVRNVSTAGIGLVHTHRIKADFLVIEFRTENSAVQIAMSVSRCRPLGPFFEIAGEFVTRLVRTEDLVATHLDDSQT